MGKRCCCCNCCSSCFSWCCCCKCCKKDKQETNKEETDDGQPRYGPDPTNGSSLQDEEGSIYNGSSTYEQPITMQPAMSTQSLNQPTYIPGSHITVDSAFSESGSDINPILTVSGLLDINGTAREVRGTLIIQEDRGGTYNTSLGRGNSGLARSHTSSRSMSPSRSIAGSVVEVKGMTSRPISSAPMGISSKPISSTHLTKRPLPETPENNIANRPPLKIPEEIPLQTIRVVRNDTMATRIDKALPRVYSSSLRRSSSSSSDEIPSAHGSASLNRPKSAPYGYDYNRPYDHRMQYPKKVNEERRKKNKDKVVEDDSIYGNVPIIKPIRDQLKHKRPVPPPPIALRVPVPAPRILEEQIYCEIEL